MFYQIMKYLRNFFHIRGAGKSGTFSVVGGEISLPFLKDGQYFHIEGSIFNDGVYQYPAYGLTDETFVGFISPMAVPKEFLDLVHNISEWEGKNNKIDMSPYQSESFGGYSYTRATNKNGDLVGWQDQFKSELKQWRKV